MHMALGFRLCSRHRMLAGVGTLRGHLHACLVPNVYAGCVPPDTTYLDERLLDGPREAPSDGETSGIGRFARVSEECVKWIRRSVEFDPVRECVRLSCRVSGCLGTLAFNPCRPLWMAGLRLSRGQSLTICPLGAATRRQHWGVAKSVVKTVF